ncbi:MAG: hypothetical protein M5T61_19330 [Acidimicrobiia bacterium]|nr:hypothetical protein [Acidimicrobiia bacterium]
MATHEIFQTALAAITATAHGDKASASAAVDQLAHEFDARDSIEAACGLASLVVTMLGSEGDGILRELAKWVAEQP